MNELGVALAAGASPPSGRRDVRIDFLRGLALLFIFVDHVPDSLLSLLSPRSYAFADAAELFFFLSGFVAAMVYGRTAESKSLSVATKQIWRRAWVLYVAQILLLTCLAAEIALAVAATGHGSYQHQFRLDALFSQPATAVMHALLLRFQPRYLDILPLYVLFMIAFPAVLAGLTRNRWLVLVPSFALYLAVQVWSVTLHTFPNDEDWFFNPLAWQFLFVFGASLGHPQLSGRWTFFDSKWLLRAAIVIAGAAALIQLPEALRTIWPEIASLRPIPLPLDKDVMAPLRLVSFFALALLVRRYAPAGAALARVTAGRLVIRCGQHSLQIFCLGVVLSVAGRIIAEETNHSILVQFCVSLIGIALLVAFASYLDGLRQGRFRLPAWFAMRQPA